MVSKVAVIALVAIVAIPILMGYAMNLSQVQESYYDPSGESVNVTPLLQDSIAYNYAHATVLQLNTRFADLGTNQNILPVYLSTGTVKSSFPLYQDFYTGSYAAINNKFSLFETLFEEFDYNTGGYILIKVYDLSNNVVRTIYRAHTFYVDQASQRLLYSFFTDNTYTELSYAAYSIPDMEYKIVVSDSGGFVGSSLCSYSFATSSGISNTSYVDFSAGFRLPANGNHRLLLPQYTKSIVITLDLSTVTDSSYAINFGPNWQLSKITTGGIIHWYVTNTQTSEITELYYDQTKSSNTYQLKVWTDNNTAQPTGTPGYYTYDRHFEYRYVGDWPTIIGEANYFMLFDFVKNITATSEPNFDIFPISGAQTPRMRVDDAEYRAFEYPIIENKTYTPANFKSNPSTTLNGLQIYGSSIEFGGNTYAVKNGSITLNGKQISLNGIEFNSIPNSSGSGYDNRIGGTVISTTAQPSTITFNGKWGVSVSTIALEEKTTVKTEWTPGHFGWDGMDQNFLMVGLLTSIGVFIALGLYVRRSRSSLWPLLIVCGGAVMLFFIML